MGRRGHRTKVQTGASGPHRGGCLFRRGTLYHLLSNRIYLGEIVHKGEAYPGEHQAIIEHPLFEAVQDKLAARGPGAIDKQRENATAPLLGVLYDGLGRAMTSSHTKKGSKRYRYYVTRDASQDTPAWRVSAHDIESIVRDQLRTLLLDADRIARMAVIIDPSTVHGAIAGAARLAASGRIRNMAIDRIDLNDDHLLLSLNQQRLLGLCGLSNVPHGQTPIVLSAPIKKVRRGHELRLIIPSDVPAPPRTHNEKLVRLISDAMEARTLVLASPDQTLKQVAAAHGRCRKRLTKLLRVSWMSPNLVRSIVDGDQPTGLTAAHLLDADLPLAWSEQAAALA
jgi:site-specific DNA recombinase